ncbi:MAG: DUF2306 domain-containing protein [Terricaulis sp.]
MSITARLGWGTMALLSVLVALYAFFHVVTGFTHVPNEVASNGFAWPAGLQVHIAAAGVALLLGPFQFLRTIRTKAPALHRWIGRGYVAACFAGGIAGGAIAMYSASGPIAGAGFLSLAVLSLLCTGLALRAAFRRDFQRHERWMIRSFALTFAAVTLRLYLPIGITLNHGEFALPYTIIAWLSWVPNLLIAEAWLASRRRDGQRTSPLKV